MAPGAVATGVNIAGTAAGSIAAQKALQEAGIPLDSPLAQMLLTTGMGAVGGISGGGGTPTEGYGALSPGEEIPIGVASKQGMVPTDILTASPEIQNAYANSVLSGADTFVVPDLNAPADPNFRQQGLKGLQSGLETYKGMTSAPTGGGLNAADVYDPRMETYNTEMTAYNQALEDYNSRLKLQEEYEQKMNDFMTRSNAFRTYQQLRGKQAGLSSQIAGNIAANPFYDVEENLTGIQSQLL
jgi:hypothetical protein